MRHGIFVSLSCVVLGGLLLSQAAAAGAALTLQGEGVQIYICAASGGGGAWILKAPDAVLRDVTRRVVGRHYAGPSWRGADGSLVIGAPLVASAAPKPGAVAWLVLRAASNGGDGMFAHVAYITRTNTVGGKAPVGTCKGTETRVPYQATYTFFSP